MNDKRNYSNKYIVFYVNVKNCEFEDLDFDVRQVCYQDDI